MTRDAFTAPARAVMFTVLCATGCDLLVGIRDVRDTGPASASSSATSGSGGAGGASCTPSTIATVCGQDTICRKHACAAGVCTASDAPSGTPCDAGGARCDGMGTCRAPSPCVSDDDCSPAAHCDANSKTCAADLAQGKPCAKHSQCQGNANCVDGVCCDDACSGVCRACDQASTGAPNGVCSSLKGKPDPGSCDATSGACGTTCACDSAGQCKRAPGQMCIIATQCASGFCVDGVCCDTACTGPCEACVKALGAAKDGTCGQHVVKATPDAGGCDGMTSGDVCAGPPCTCDAQGICKGQLGAPCQTNAHCIGGYCVDGVCCDSSCTGACAACSLALGASADGSCTSKAIKGKVDPGGCALVGCPNPPCSCDASGSCKGDIGAACTTGLECSSGNCCGTCC
jgi:hypothetical protein